MTISKKHYTLLIILFLAASTAGVYAMDVDPTSNQADMEVAETGKYNPSLAQNYVKQLITNLSKSDQAQTSGWIKVLLNESLAQADEINRIVKNNRLENDDDKRLYFGYLLVKEFVENFKRDMQKSEQELHALEILGSVFAMNSSARNQDEDLLTQHAIAESLKERGMDGLIYAMKQTKFDE